MATETLFCNFHQFGHCKFGQTCKKFHTKETCTTFHCKYSDCTLRHPKMCKFFARRSWCKFGEECSFSHFSANEHFANKKEIETLKAENEALKTRTLLLEAKISKIDTIEEELKALKTEINSQVTENVNQQEPEEIQPEDNSTFKCDFCEYTSLSRKGVNIHKGSKHKNQTRTSSTPAPTSTLSESSNAAPILKSPRPCYRQDEGCTNIVTDYFDEHSALCNDCIHIMEQKQKESPFPPNLCPCCQAFGGEADYSLCQECLDYLNENGFVESDFGSWVLNRDKGKILCVILNLNT